MRLIVVLGFFGVTKRYYPKAVFPGVDQPRFLIFWPSVVYDIFWLELAVYPEFEQSRKATVGMQNEPFASVFNSWNPNSVFRVRCRRCMLCACKPKAFFEELREVLGKFFAFNFNP